MILNFKYQNLFKFGLSKSDGEAEHHILPDGRDRDEFEYDFEWRLSEEFVVTTVKIDFIKFYD